MTDARISAADARAELIALGVAPWTDPNEEVAAVVAATLDCFLARPDLLAALVSVARPAAVTVEMVEAAYQAWWRERATYDDNLRLRAALEAAFAVTGHDDTTLRQDEVREIAPHMWREDNEHGTFVSFWWDDSEFPGSSEMWVWHLQPDGAWREYGGYGGVPGQFHEGLVAYVIKRAALDGTPDNENKGE